MGRYTLLIINSAALTGCAIFIYPQRSFVLTALMLFLPLLDRYWQAPSNINYNYRFRILAGCTLSMAALITLNPEFINIAIITLVMTALPEEWFFRAYLLTQLEKLKLHPHFSNIISSLFFSLLHLPTQGLFGLTVFFPSLVYGFIYQRTHDLPLLILLHTLSNIVFFIYIQNNLDL